MGVEVDLILKWGFGVWKVIMWKLGWGRDRSDFNAALGFGRGWGWDRDGFAFNIGVWSLEGDCLR